MGPQGPAPHAYGVGCIHKGNVMKLKVETIGNPVFPRYAIACENGVWFDGQGWSPDPKKAMRFANLRTAKDEWVRLQREMETGLIVMQATCVVTIQGLEELTPEQLSELQWYLAEASTLTLDYSKPKPAGLERSVISSQIFWDTLRRKKN